VNDLSEWLRQKGTQLWAKTLAVAQDGRTLKGARAKMILIMASTVTNGGTV